MRLNEFATAEQQLELWRLITQSVWSVLNQKQQNAAQKKQQRTSKPVSRTYGTVKKVPAVKVKPASKPPQNPAQIKTQTTAKLSSLKRPKPIKPIKPYSTEMTKNQENQQGNTEISKQRPR